MYFWYHTTSYRLISTSKFQYLESYDIKRDFRDIKLHNLVQSKKTPTYFHNVDEELCGREE